MINTSVYNLFNDVYNRVPYFGRPSVYVISDSQLAAYKRQQAEAEVLELDKLIDSHKQSIERLQSTKDKLLADMPALPEADKPAADAA